MKQRVMTVSLAGVVALSASHTWFATQGTTGVHVCVAADRIARVATGASCPAGQGSYNLALDGAQGAAPNQDKTSTSQINDLKKTVDFLRDRVSNLEKELANDADGKDKISHKVIAPFDVVDKSGKSIFRVRDDLHGFEMANAAGQTVLWASALDNGGVFKTRNSSGFPEVVMGTSGALGAFTIRDAEGQGRASLTLTGGKPSLELTNDNHVTVVSLRQASTGGGSMQLGAASGESVVQAGVTVGGNCGRVDTYPPTSPGRQMVGAAASYIMGKC